jgi:hypothetical protein
MFNAGNIIYFTPFYFKNGNAAKPKYFVVLKEIDGEAVLASLPTRKDSIPENEVIDSGCIELPDINLNCFVFSPDISVTQCNKHFDFRTHIYGYQIDSYKIGDLNDIYRIENSDYEIFGQMKEDLFNQLIDCLKTSKAVKRKYIRVLNQ